MFTRHHPDIGHDARSLRAADLRRVLVCETSHIVQADEGEGVSAEAAHDVIPVGKSRLETSKKDYDVEKPAKQREIDFS